ncbi:transglutaminase family protein [Sabulilitoribacter multivorans]|uniref:Transglutaminase family protein n=1 Tax=Flaviramulus multivorans TaxID=1304750 RepID=A0ABS9IEX7_9FLAO|nr:transglutaminase family protein [Flaviramulus multivorans]MCF7559086.1 transglutaminase family protein [Flaviramulus multivorans]
MPTFFIKHTTNYTYSNTVIDGATLTRLHPVNDSKQQVVSHTLSITNNPRIETFQDYYHNIVGSFMITEPHTKLSIISEIEVETMGIQYPNDTEPIEKQWDALFALKYHTDYIDYLKYKIFDGTPDILDIIKTKDLSTLSPYKLVLEFSEYIYKNFKYMPGITNVDSKLDLVWKLKAGVCQDFTHILLQMIRMVGIPAKYVSGYICPSGSNTRGEGATHAWIEAYIPFYGWLGFDPTNNVIANEYHVKLATGRAYSDCAPIKGVFKGNVESELHVKVEVKTNKNDLTPSFPDQKMALEDAYNSYKRNLELTQQYQQQQ